MFWTKTRNKGDGNWGQGSAYTFLGFIYNPKVLDVLEGKSELTIEYNGKLYSCIGSIENGTTYIRLRDLDNILGMCKVSWNGKCPAIRI